MKSAGEKHTVKGTSARLKKKKKYFIHMKMVLRVQRLEGKQWGILDEATQTSGYTRFANATIFIIFCTISQ